VTGKTAEGLHEKEHLVKHRKILAGLAVVVFALVVLSIPSPERVPPQGVAGEPFTWKQDKTWDAIEAYFREAKGIGCEGLKGRLDKGLKAGNRDLDLLSKSQRKPDAPVFAELEKITFGLGTMVAVCPARLGEYVDLVTRTRNVLKVQSRQWDLQNREVRNRLYRLLYGGRMALEEVMLQAPPGTYAGLVKGENEPSVTPSFEMRGGFLRSGDILVSRGGAPTSALIARGNDYPGNFSHIALLHVDEKTGVPSILEAHIERGVVISSLEEYIKDKKLRIMVLRLRADLPRMKADPMLPHKAAQKALEEVKARHIPYDFEMDFSDHSLQFCSEVASAAYQQFGIDLWQWTTHMSAPGVVRWLSDFGVTHFETQAPADLEYDPQLTVVAEWRDPEALWQDHVDSAIVEAMLEGADEGDRLTYPWYLLAPGRIAKAYCVLLNQFGRVGPIPEGMDVPAALRNLTLDGRHKAIKEKVLGRAAAFQEKQGYRPPYWELVRMANQSRVEISGKSPQPSASR
jgi:hypothetical protein